MRHRLAAITLMSLLFTVVGGCSGENTGDPSPSSEAPEPVPVSFRVVAESEIPAEIRKIIASQKTEKTEQAIRAGDGQFIFIALGQRPTGGYRVEIRSMESYGGTLRVTYGEIRPPAKAMVTQALTYPWVVAWTASTLPVEFICASTAN